MSKLLLISNLLLGGKLVRASAPNSDSFLADSLADSGRNSGETQWACLRHAHALARSEPLSSILVRGTGLAPARLSSYAPQAYGSASSPTRAYFHKDWSTIPKVFWIFNRFRERHTAFFERYIFLKILRLSVLTYFNWKVEPFPSLEICPSAPTNFLILERSQSVKTLLAETKHK